MLTTLKPNRRNAFRFPPLYLAITIFCCGTNAISYANSVSTHVQATSIQIDTHLELNITATGTALKARISELFLKLQTEGKISDNPSNACDVSNVVTQYIPVGTSFEAAEGVLRAAGFKVYPPRLNDLKSYDSKAVVAIDSAFGQNLSGHTDLYVDLEPPPDGQYEKVFSISAKFIGAHL